MSKNDDPVQRADYSWTLDPTESSSCPDFGIALSGGGNRSAVFCIGVLSALHERGLLQNAEVISAVSGGSYALSWLLLQPFYYSRFIDPDAALSAVYSRMFDRDDVFQKHLARNVRLFQSPSRFHLFAVMGLDLVFTSLLFNPLRLLTRFLPGNEQLKNKYSTVRASYRDSIQHAYQGLPTGKRARLSNSYTMSAYEATHHIEICVVDPVSFPEIRVFGQTKKKQPLSIFNATVDVDGRREVFAITPMGMGSESLGYRTWESLGDAYPPPGERVPRNPFKKEFRQEPDPFWTVRNVNVAPAISGAAISESQKLVAAANLGLDYKIPSFDLGSHLRLSDGGYSENLAAYSLLQRRCRKILIVDAEHDPDFTFAGCRKLRRLAKSNLALKLESDVDSFDENQPMFRMTATDTKSGQRCEIVYLKLAMGADMERRCPSVVRSYQTKSNSFPQESTIDQYFEEQQFLAYRELGYQIARDGIATGVLGCGTALSA